MDYNRVPRTAAIVTVVRSLWASVQGDPVFMRRVNGWLTIFWAIMIPIAYEAGWLTSITFVSALSLWALVSGHWSAWQAAAPRYAPGYAPDVLDRHTCSRLTRVVEPNALAQKV